MTPPPTDPKRTTNVPPPDGDSPSPRPDGKDIEELNRQSQPKGPGGEVVDPHQEQDPQTGG